MKNKFLLWFWILFPLLAFSQGENDNWYFGDKAAVNFAGTPVALTNSVMSAPEACGSVSDAQGNLLFYTDGMTIWDHDHNIMPNGTGLTGTVNSAQTLIIGDLSNRDRYYVFTTADSYNNQSYTAYSVVDMSLGGLGSTGQPLGDVDPAVKNVPVLDNNGNLITTGAVTAVPHANGTDFWILIPTHNDFLAFLFDGSGISNTPTVTPLIPFASYPYRSFYVKASPRLSYPIGFDYIVAMGMGNNLLASQCDIYGFDNSTGILLSSFGMSFVSVSTEETVEFNEDGTIMYLAVEVFGDAYFFKYDIINNIHQQVSGIIPAVTPGQIQRNKKGEIYVSIDGSPDLAQILNPNSFATCSINATAVSLNGQKSLKGLPQLFPENPGCVSDILLVAPEINNNFIYRAANSITTQTNYSINAMNIDMKAGENILLLPDTEISLGTNYTAVIEFCPASKPSQRYWLPPSERQIYTVGGENNLMVEKSNVKIYPNPTSGSFIIDTAGNDIQNWELFDLSGKRVLQGKESVGSVEGLAKATYILRVSLKSNEVNTHKLIVK